MKLIINKKYSFLTTILKYSFVFVLFFTLTMPIIIVNAADFTKITGINFKLKNPINVDSIPEFIKSILNIVLTIGIPIVALAIIYCGFLFVIARGKKEALTKAKDALLYTIIGAFLLLGAWVLATAIDDTVKEIITNAK